MQALIDLLNSLIIDNRSGANLWAFDAFPTKSKTYTPPPPPFICLVMPGSNNMAADNKVYTRIEQIRLELYTEAKDPASEQIIRNALDKAEIVYNTEETAIPDDRLYEVAFNFSMIIK